MPTKSKKKPAYAQGQEIRWRDSTTARLWKVGFCVGQRNQWILVRLADGNEIEVHPKNVREKT